MNEKLLIRGQGLLKTEYLKFLASVLKALLYVIIAFNII